MPRRAKPIPTAGEYEGLNDFDNENLITWFLRGSKDS